MYYFAMRSLALLVLAICFVSVSAITIYDKTNAALAANGTGWSTSSAQLATEAVSSFASTKATGKKSDIRKDRCACKQKSDTQTLTCGVTLALSDQKPDSDIAMARQAWSAVGQSDRNKQLLYLLKRPPRIILQS